MRRGRGHCPRLQVARPLGSLPLQVGAPAGAAAFAGGSARESAPAGGAVSLAAAPAGFLPVGAAATGAAALRCLSPRCCPAAPLPAGSVAAGASTERAPSPAGRKPAASRPPAGCCRHSACACAGAVLPGCGCGCRCRWLQACRSRAATVVALPCFCVNDFDVKILPKHNTRSSKPIIRTNNLALIPLLGNHRGRHHMRSGRTRKTKSQIPKKMFVVVRRLVRKNPQNTKLRIEIVLPREIVYPCFLADP